jgi:hypothetical protein
MAFGVLAGSDIESEKRAYKQFKEEAKRSRWHTPREEFLQADLERRIEEAKETARGRLTEAAVADLLWDLDDHILRDKLRKLEVVDAYYNNNRPGLHPLNRSSWSVGPP